MMEIHERRLASCCAPRHCRHSSPPSSRDGGVEWLLLRSLRGARQWARLYTSDALCDDGGPAPSTQTSPTAPTARTAAERVSGIIFVVDAADASRFDEARQELHKLLSEPRLRGVPLLANKMDLPEVEAALGWPSATPDPTERAAPSKARAASAATASWPRSSGDVYDISCGLMNHDIT